MLDLVVLDGVVLLSLRGELALRRLFLRELHHHQALRYAVQFVLEHDDTLEVHLGAKIRKVKLRSCAVAFIKEDLSRLTGEINLNTKLTEMERLSLLDATVSAGAVCCALASGSLAGLACAGRLSGSR